MGKVKDKTKGSDVATGKRVSVRKKKVQEVPQQHREDKETGTPPLGAPLGRLKRGGWR